MEILVDTMETTTNTATMIPAVNASILSMLCFLLGVVASYDLSLNDMTCFTSPSMNFTAFFIIHYFNLILQGFAELFFSAKANFVDFPKYASPHMCNSAK